MTSPTDATDSGSTDAPPVVAVLPEDHQSPFHDGPDVGSEPSDESNNPDDLPEASGSPDWLANPSATDAPLFGDDSGSSDTAGGDSGYDDSSDGNSGSGDDYP